MVKSGPFSDHRESIGGRLSIYEEREKNDNKLYMCYKKEKKMSYFNPFLVLFLPGD